MAKKCKHHCDHTAPPWWKHCVVKDYAPGVVQVLYSAAPIPGEYCTPCMQYHTEASGAGCASRPAPQRRAAAPPAGRSGPE